jgi:hypothetical protein
LVSTTRGSGRGEAKVRAALDVVESGQGSGTFYRAEEATKGRGDGAVRGMASGASEMKGVGHRFGSTPTVCGRVMDGGAWSGGSVGGERRPRWAELGRTAGYSGRQGKIPEKINKRAAREFWAGLISGCAEKKKKIFRFLIQGMIFKFKFF